MGWNFKIRFGCVFIVKVVLKNGKLVICKPDKMKTTTLQRTSHVQGGIIVENRGGNTTFAVEIGKREIHFGKLIEKEGSCESDKFG